MSRFTLLSIVNFAAYTALALFPFFSAVPFLVIVIVVVVFNMLLLILFASFLLSNFYSISSSLVSFSYFLTLP
jgi:hypothetical protein